MPTLPLIAHRRLDAVIAWRGNAPVSVRQFLGEVGHVAGQLPPGRHVLNLCGDRYRFTVALAACIVSGRVSLLPSTHTPETVRQMRDLAPDVFCIVDRDGGGVDLPTFRYPESMPPPADTLAIPEIDCAQVVAQVFTSGSTGVPVPHAKHWGSLVRNVQAEAERLGIGAAHAILGTVPPQHMYGLESTVLMPLQSGAALHAGRPFYPADICTALANLPRPRMLVTTPYHLRALLAEPATLPAADQLLSATAPLSHDLAVEAEARFGAPLVEIYGCTETGQLASRRTTAGAEWRTLRDIRLRRDGQTIRAEGGHIDSPTSLADVIELTGAGPVSTTFLLHGRHADLVNIAGKRSSLAYLNHQLNAIAGVQDGVFLLPREDSPDGIGRLAALVVAPGLTPAALTRALRERIDPVFLPRPLLFVEALPRNATGKLPSLLTHELLSTLQGASGDAGMSACVLPLPIPADHPAYAGHFPGQPILPGVVLLDAALHALASQQGWAGKGGAVQLNAAKFLSPVRPGEALTLHASASPAGGVRFEIRCADAQGGERSVASGSVVFSQASLA